MQEVLQQLQKELKETQILMNDHEKRRDVTPRGSASWRYENEGAMYYRGEVNGLKRAIQAIERAGATK